MSASDALTERPHALACDEDTSSKLVIGMGEIHLWLAFYDEIVDPKLHEAYRELLDPAEKAQEPRFYFATDRHRYLVTRALVRTVLSRYRAVTPANWCFSTNAYGRPQIANADTGAADLSFNISHTQGLIVLAVAKSAAIGVDVESLAARAVSIDIADRYFAADEVAALASVPQAEQQYRFFEYWTFKEAYIKARGMGLSLPLDKFSFHYPDEQSVRLTIQPELNDDEKHWRLWQCRPSSKHLLALCAERVGEQSPKIVVRRIVPMLTEQMLAPVFQRISN